MNKKGQGYAQPQQGGMAQGAPLPVILGIIFIAGPMIGNIWNVRIPFQGFFFGLGIFLIIVGVIMYALK